jgi:2-polyprenyl-6-methoxyphenol hydroxylase-like FAD-dependent oxidoreductase
MVLFTLTSKYGYDLESFTSSGDTVDVTFTNGEKVTGNLLIGADGAKSKARELLLGEEGQLLPMEFVFAGVTVKYSAELAKSLLGENEQFIVGVHPKGLIFIACTSESLEVRSCLQYSDGCSRRREARNLVVPSCQ